MNGPEAALVVESDISFIIIGACFLVFLILMIVITVTMCRLSNKLDLCLINLKIKRKLFFCARKFWIFIQCIN